MTNSTPDALRRQQPSQNGRPHLKRGGNPAVQAWAATKPAALPAAPRQAPKKALPADAKGFLDMDPVPADTPARRAAVAHGLEAREVIYGLLPPNPARDNKRKKRELRQLEKESQQDLKAEADKPVPDAAWFIPLWLFKITNDCGSALLLRQMLAKFDDARPAKNAKGKFFTAPIAREFGNGHRRWKLGSWRKGARDFGWSVNGFRQACQRLADKGLLLFEVDDGSLYYRPNACKLLLEYRGLDGLSKQTVQDVLANLRFIGKRERAIEAAIETEREPPHHYGWADTRMRNVLLSSQMLGVRLRKAVLDCCGHHHLLAALIYADLTWMKEHDFNGGRPWHYYSQWCDTFRVNRDGVGKAVAWLREAKLIKTQERYGSHSRSGCDGLYFTVLSLPRKGPKS